MLRVDIDGPRGALQVFSTHLNWRLDHSHVRQAQVHALAEIVADARPRSYPAIVCGDFNAEPGSPEIQLVEAAGWVSAGPDGVPTSPSQRPRQKIDWVFGQGVTFGQATVLVYPQQSDHLPLVAQLRITD